MTMKLRDFLLQDKYRNPDALNVAGHIEGEKFYYLESTNKALPAAIHLLERKRNELTGGSARTAREAVGLITSALRFILFNR